MAGGLVETGEDAFAAANFDDPGSGNITNTWWTLPEGSNFLYFAESEDGCAWNLVEVLDTYDHDFDPPYDEDTETRIVLDREWLDEDCLHETWAAVLAAIDAEDLEPEEATYDWYAQDDTGNVWYMGEDTYDSEGSSEGSFVAGCDGALAGIVMLGNPSNGDFYQQEYYEEEAEDWGKVLNFKKLKGPEGIICMRTKEWTPLEHGAIEQKFYCSDGETGELSLVKELKGKTVMVELIGMDVDSPADYPESNPSPEPDCPEPEA